MSRGAIVFLSMICCAQFALLLLIYSKADAVSEDLQISNFPASIESLSNSVVRGNDQMNSSPVNELITEDRLRRIIQEELRSHLGRMDLNASQQQAQLIAEQDVDGAVVSAQREFVLGQLDYYSSVGSISAADMTQLQMEIAKLDETGRKEMMSRLNRALNTGELKGNL